jgi:hypothetical protein
MLKVERSERGFFVPASLVVIGDNVVLGSGAVSVIVDINVVSRKGAFAPFTKSGTIIVNGVVASSYVSMQDNSDMLVIGGHKTPLSMHWLAHLFQSHHRLACDLSWKFCAGETYTGEGISTWVSWSHQLGKALLEQNGFIVVLVLMPIMLLHLVTATVEAAVRWWLVLLLVVFMSSIQIWKRMSSKSVK